MNYGANFRMEKTYRKPNSNPNPNLALEKFELFSLKWYNMVNFGKLGLKRKHTCTR